MSVENIYQQIKGQSQNLGTAKTFQTGAAGTKEGGLGSVDAVMRDMAQRLSDAGLTSIEQLGQGQIPVYQRATAYPETKQGRFIGQRGDSDALYEQVPTGRWLYQIATEYGDGGTQLSAPKLVSEAEVARLNLSGTQPKSVDITTGTKTGYINKATGEPIPQFDNVKGGGWGRNTAGDGQTVYGVQFDPTTGLPIFVNAQTHGRDQYADLLKIAAIGTAIFAPQIGAALLPAGSSAAAALAVGSAVSGFIGSGGNLEAGIKAGLAGYLGGQAGSWASKASNSALVGNIASNMTRTAILGGNMEQALVASLVQSAPAVISQNFPNFAQLPRAAQEAAVAATVDLMRTGGDNLEQIALQGATKGATDYALSNIEGYKDLRPAQQEIIRTRVSNVLGGASLSNELLQGAISMGSEAVQNEVNNDRAKKAGWADYATQQAAQSLYGSKVTPAEYENKQYTTEDEAKQIARDILGREPTEFEYMQLIGLPEREAAQNSDLAAIKYDESTFDSNELANAYKAKYGVAPSDDWLASDEAMDMLGRSDAQGKNMLDELYTKDKNTVTKDEAVQFWRDAGFSGNPTDEQLKFLTSGNEATAETYAIRTNDIYETTFDGSKYDSKDAAQKAATAAGYNTYTWDGSDYNIPTTAETKAIEEKRYELTEGILKQQGTTIDKATDAQLKEALDKVDAVPTSYLKNATIQDVIKGTYSAVNADGTLRVEISGAAAVSNSPAEKANKAADQLPNGMVLASDEEVWGVDGARNPNVEYMVLPDGSSAFVKKSDGGSLDDFALRGFDLHGGLDELATNDPEAWLFMAAEFDKKQDGDLGTYLSGTANSLMLGAYATGNKEFGDIVKQTLSITTQGVGEQVQNLSTFFSDRLGMDHNTALAKAGAALQEWGAANQSKSTKDQEAAIISAVSNAKSVGDKIGAFVTAAKNNPGGLVTMIAKEGVQEILPLWAAKAAYRLGSLAAVSANTAVEAMESWGAGTKGTYDEAKKMGLSDEEARTMASKVGLQSAVITTFTNGFGDNPLVKRIIGDTVKDSAMGIAKAGGREAFTEYFDGLGSNAVQQYQLTGNVNWDQAITAATIGAGVGAGTSSGIMLGAAINSNAVIGRGLDGSDVTYADFLSGAKQVDMGTVNLSSPVGTDADGDAITLGNLVAMPVASGLSYDVVKAGLPAALTNSDVVLGTDELGNTVTLSSLMSGVTETKGFDVAYKNLLNITPEQRTEAKYDYVSNLYGDLGYTPTQQEINELIAQNPTVTQIDRSGVEAYVDPRMVTEQEVRDAYAELGLDEPTQADIDKLIGQYQQEELAGRAQENLGTAQFNVTTAKQEAVAKELADLEAKTTEQYNSLTVEQKAMADALAAQGITLADAIATAKSETQTQISELEAATKAQYETLTAAQKAAADALVAQGQTLQDAITAAKTETAGQIADVETRLTDAIAAAEAMGLTRDQAITAAVESVAADLGTTKDALLTQLGTTEQALRTEFTTGLAGVSAEVKAAYDSLTADQKALADQLAQQGVDLTTAIQTAQEQTQTQIGELTADVQAKFDALTEEQKALATSLQQQGVDLNTAIETAQQQTQQQITDLGVEVDARINELMQQGQTYQQATQTAFAEVNAKNQEMAGLIGTQGRTASQQDIDALTEMLGGQRSMDLAYDVTGDKQITQADIDFLTQVVGGTKTDWTAPQESPWAATGLYGQIQANELRRQQDLAAAEAQRVADQQAAAQAAAEQARQANIRTTATRAQTSAQGIMQQLEAMQRAGMAPQQPAQLVEAGPGFDVSAALNTGFFSGFQAKKEQQNQQPTTKIAAGGYIDDLLAGDMTADDLLNLLR